MQLLSKLIDAFSRAALTLHLLVPDPRRPLPSFCLLVPPLQLLSAAMWQLAKQKDVRNYERLQDFVLMVTEAVPGLINHRQRAQLVLGLRARVSRICMSSHRGHGRYWNHLVVTLCLFHSSFWRPAKAQLVVLLILKQSRAIWIDCP